MRWTASRTSARPWEAQARNTYVLRRRPDRARGALPVPLAQVRRLRTTLAGLLRAKTALDAAQRVDTKMTDREQRALLEAVEEPNALLDGLLRRVEKD